LTPSSMASDSKAKLSVKVHSCVLGAAIPCCLTLQCAFKNSAGTAEQTDLFRTDTQTPQDVTVSFKKAAFEFVVPANVKAAHCRILFDLLKLPADAKAGSNPKGVSVGDGACRLSQVAEELVKGGEISQRVQLGEAFVIVKLQYRPLSASSLDLKSFVPPPQHPEVLSEDFLQSKIPAGTGVHVAQRKEQPLHADAAANARPPAESQVQLLPNAVFRSLTIGVARVFNLSKPASIVCKAKYCGGVDMSAMTREARQAAVATNLAVQGFSRSKADRAVLSFTTASALVAARQLSTAALAAGTSLVANMLLAEAQGDGEECRAVMVVQQALDTDAIRDSQQKDPDGAYVRLDIGSGFPWDSVDHEGGTVCCVRCVAGVAAAPAQGDEFTELEPMEVEADDEGAGWGASAFADASAEERLEASSAVQYCLVAPSQSGRCDVWLPADVLAASDASLVVTFFHCIPGDPVDDEAGPHGDVDPMCVPMFVGSSSMSLKPVASALASKGSVVTTLSGIISNAASAAAANVTVSVVGWAAAPLKAETDARASREAELLAHANRYAQDSGALVSEEQAALARRNKTLNPNPLGPSKSKPPTPTQPLTESPGKRPETVAAPRRFGRPNQTPYAPESMKEGFVPALPPGDETRLESMVREAEKKLEVRFHMERTQMMEQLSFFKRECEGKNASCERLQQQLEEAHLIIKKCGLEIVELRQHQQRLLADKAELVARVEADSKAALDVPSDSAIVSLDRAELEQRFKMLSEAYKREKSASAELVARMKTLHKESLKNKDAATKLAQLEDAHMSQAKTMQQLQEQNGKLAQYVQATRDQEKVIERLEDVMEKTLAEARQGRDIKAERDMLHTEILRRARAAPAVFGFCLFVVTFCPRFKAENDRLRNAVDLDVAEQLEQVQRERELERRQLQEEIEALRRGGTEKMSSADLQKYADIQEELERMRSKSEAAEKELAEIRGRSSDKPIVPVKAGGMDDGERERMRLLMRAEKVK
jgi:hypothetical protein